MVLKQFFLCSPFAFIKLHFTCPVLSQNLLYFEMHFATYVSCLLAFFFKFCISLYTRSLMQTHAIQRYNKTKSISKMPIANTHNIIVQFCSEIIYTNKYTQLSRANISTCQQHISAQCVLLGLKRVGIKKSNNDDDKNEIQKCMLKTIQRWT